MKKYLAWIIWIVLVIILIVSLVQMFLKTPYWIAYAIFFGVSYYLTRKIHQKYLLR